MSKYYKRLISENIAPANASVIGVLDKNGKLVGKIELGSLKKKSGTKLFSFALLSDIHLNKSNPNYPNSVEIFTKILDFCKEKGLKLITINGDITTNQENSEYGIYSNFLTKYSDLEIYTNTGNHDMGYQTNYKETPKNPNVLTTKEAFDEYTHQETEDLCFSKTVTYGGKNFYFNFLSLKKGQLYYEPSASYPLFYVDSDIDWLENKLKNQTDGLSFVFVHVPFPDRAGDFGYSYSRKSVLKYNNLTRLKELSNTYKKTIWMCGHTHDAWELQGLKFTISKEELQVLVDNGSITQEQANAGKGSNYDANVWPCNTTNRQSGWHLHIPCVNMSRYKKDLVGSDKEDNQSQFAIVDVYSDHVEIKGCTFNNTPSNGTISSQIKYVPIAQYYLDF